MTLVISQRCFNCRINSWQSYNYARTIVQLFRVKTFVHKPVLAYILTANCRSVRLIKVLVFLLSLEMAHNNFSQIINIKKAWGRRPRIRKGVGNLVPPMYPATDTPTRSTIPETNWLSQVKFTFLKIWPLNFYPISKNVKNRNIKKNCGKYNQV